MAPSAVAGSDHAQTLTAAGDTGNACGPGLDRDILREYSPSPSPAAAMTVATPPLAADLIACWRLAGPRLWFARDDGFDAQLRERFGVAHHRAACGEFDDWMDGSEGALALLLLLDQVPRNIFRGSAHAFACDPLARKHARAAFAAGHDLRIELPLRLFMYLPLEHSEDLADQDEAVARIAVLGDALLLDYAHRHRDVIARFGRFPHRNAALARVNTAAEQQWLDAGGGF